MWSTEAQMSNNTAKMNYQINLKTPLNGSLGRLGFWFLPHFGRSLQTEKYMHVLIQKWGSKILRYLKQSNTQTWDCNKRNKISEKLKVQVN